MKLSVIIVNHNVKYFLEQCLCSVLKAISSIEAEIIVIDNNSTDGSIDYLQPMFPSVKFLANKMNLGFGKANNTALAVAKGAYVLFLNPDTLVPEDCFIKCICFLEEHSSAGAVGVKMIDGRGNFLPESKRSFPTTVTAIYKATGLSSLFPASKRFNKYSLGFLDENKDHKIDVLAGAFMMVRKDLLDKTGGFDENFFMYGEDIDLSYRLRQTGFENWYLSQPVIIHFKGESSKKDSLNHTKMFYEAMIVFVRKHYKKKAGSLLRFTLIAAIKVKSVFVRIKKRYRVVTHPSSSNVIIIGTKEEVDECSEFIQNTTKKISGTIEADEMLSSGFIDAYCRKHQATEIIFCHGYLQYSKIIDMMMQLGPNYFYRFHSNKTKSIIGSDNKAETGEVLSFN